MGAYLYAGWETWWWKPGGSEVFLLADWWTGLCNAHRFSRMLLTVEMTVLVDSTSLTRTRFMLCSFWLIISVFLSHFFKFWQQRVCWAAANCRLTATESCFLTKIDAKYVISQTFRRWLSCSALLLLQLNRRSCEKQTAIWSDRYRFRLTFYWLFSCLKFSAGPVFQCVNSSVFYWAAWIRGESQFLSFSVHALSVVAQTDLVHIFSSTHSNVFCFVSQSR